MPVMRGISMLSVILELNSIYILLFFSYSFITRSQIKENGKYTRCQGEVGRISSNKFIE